MKKDNTIEITKTLNAFSSSFRSTRSVNHATRGILRFILNATVALTLLIGNSSFTLLTYGQEVDSAKIASTEESLELNDKKGLKISIPTRNMIRRADIEINRNMNEWIKMINNFKISQFDPFEADQQIRNNFLGSFILCLKFANADVEDQLNVLFNSENIRLLETKHFLKSDVSIDNMFKSTLYMNYTTGRLLQSDMIITNVFHTDNP